MERQPAVYIMASGRTGVKRRVWFGMADTMDVAITREKQLKVWGRAWKIESIEASNANWRDLPEDLGFGPLPSS
jgi:putative endonuclease